MTTRADAAQAKELTRALMRSLTDEVIGTAGISQERLTKLRNGEVSASMTELRAVARASRVGVGELLTVVERRMAW